MQNEWIQQSKANIRYLQSKQVKNWKGFDFEKMQMSANLVKLL